MDNRSVKENISRIRRSKGLSQEQMAEEMGISRTAYRNIESGSTRLISDSLGKISSILGITPEELLLGYVPAKGDSQELNEVKVRYGERIQRIESDHADEIKRLQEHIGILDKLISSLQETLRTKDEVIMMLRKSIPGNMQ